MELPNKVKDISGQRWGMLTAASYAYSKDGACWNFRCDCGVEKVFPASVVRCGKRVSCGCINQMKAQPGKSFNGVLVLALLISSGKHKKISCKCHCGEFFSAYADNVSSGKTRSCGCLVGTMKGMTKQPAYQTWKNMTSRCLDPSNKRFKDYGGRGVMVCERWLNYLNFFSDMGNPPEGMTIDRKDNKKGYSPENCKWSTILDQANNKRNNVFIECCGETRTIAQWSRHLGISYSKIYSMYRKGYPMSEIVKCV